MVTYYPQKTAKCCPIETALKYIGKKWSINIIRDLFMGKRRFRDFLNSSAELSTKMLSQRLKELEKDKWIIPAKKTGEIHYSLNPEKTNEILKFYEKCCSE